MSAADMELDSSGPSHIRLSAARLQAWSRHDAEDLRQGMPAGIASEQLGPFALPERCFPGRMRLSRSMSDRRCGEGAAGGRRVPAWQVGTVADHGNLGAMACGVWEQPHRICFFLAKWQLPQ